MELSVSELLEKFNVDTDHAEEVRRLSCLLFDEVNSKLKDLPEEFKSYIEASALLHDIGYYIEEKGHNKHSQKMVLDYGLKGFTQKEKEIISCICRYHRGSLPDKELHDVYSALDQNSRKIVKRLSAIVKVADGLAETPANFIKKIRIEQDYENDITYINLIANSYDYRPDIKYAVRKKDLFEVAFKTQVVFKFVHV